MCAYNLHQSYPHLHSRAKRGRRANRSNVRLPIFFLSFPNTDGARDLIRFRQGFVSLRRGETKLDCLFHFGVRRSMFGVQKRRRDTPLGRMSSPVPTPWKVWAYQPLQPSMLKRTPRASDNHADTAGFKGSSRSTRQQTHRRRDLCPNHARAHTLEGVGMSASSAEHAKTHLARIGQPRRYRRF